MGNVLGGDAITQEFRLRNVCVGVVSLEGRESWIIHTATRVVVQIDRMEGGN